MGKFLNLLASPAEEWKNAEEKMLTPGTYVFRVGPFKIMGEDDALLANFRAEKQLDGDGEPITANFLPVMMRFSERNEWQFVQFAKAVDLPLDNAEQHLPTVVGKLFKARVVHAENKKEPSRPFANLRDIALYDPDAPAPGLANTDPREEDSALD